MAGCQGFKAEIFWSAGQDELKKSIVRRRSIREFSPESSMSCSEYESIFKAAAGQISSDCDQKIAIWSLVHRVDDMQPGLYRDSSCLRQGNFAEICGYLCLEQQLGAESGVTFFLTASAKNYLPLMQKAGLMGQRIYLAATLLNIGCSGIGAFYDQETADFLDTGDMILYAVAVGR
jgi:nitroreductase